MTVCVYVSLADDFISREMINISSADWLDTDGIIIVSAVAK